MKPKPRINHDYTWYRLKLVKSPIHRYGVIAEVDIPARKYVIEYTGILYSRRNFKKIKDWIYVWTVGCLEPSYWVLDGKFNGSGAEFVNHSCDPNLQPIFYGKRLYYKSLRPIKKGEELTIDYGDDYWGEDSSCCTCGTQKCLRPKATTQSTSSKH